MLIGALLLVLTSPVFAQVPTAIRSVSTLPATCKGGSAVAPSDVVILITGGVGQLEECVATNTWKPVPNWAVPGTIGSTTPNTGAFTTLVASVALTIPPRTSTQIGSCSSGNVGQFTNASDSNTQAIGTIYTGGGALFVSIVCNGTNWIVFAGGNPLANITASPGTLTFGSVQDTVTSPAQSVILTNGGAGTPAGTITSISISGTNAADFAQTNSCIGTIAGGANCPISVTFTPSIIGSESATLTIANTGLVPSLTVSLSGSGASAPTFSLTLLSGGGQGLGVVTSGDQTVNCNFSSAGTSGNCAPNYASGTVQTLTAVPQPNNALLSVVGTGNASGCSSTTSLVCGPITITSNSTLTYTFQPVAQTESLNIVFAGSGSGTVLGSANASSINCISVGGVQSNPPGCSQLVLSGASITLTATPSGGSTFVSWTGVAGCGVATTCGPFSISANTIVTANFAPSSVPLTLVQAIPLGTTGTDTILGNWALPINAGDTLFVTGDWFDSSTVVSVADNCGNTYTQISCSPKTVAAANGQTALTAVFYYAKNVAAASAGACTTTMTLSANAVGRAFHGKDFSGLTTNPFDTCSGAVGQDNAGSAAPASGSITPTAGDLLLGFDALTTGISAASTGYTQNFYNLYSNGFILSQAPPGSSSFTSTTGTKTFSNAVTTGDSVFGMVTSNSHTDTLSSVTSSTGSTCTVRGPSTQTTAGSVWLFDCLGVTGSAYPWYVTATFASGSSTRAIWIAEFSTGGRVPTFDSTEGVQTGSGTTGTAVNNPTCTPTNGNSFIFGGVNNPQGIASVNSPWTAGSIGHFSDYDAYQLSASGAQAMNMTASSSGPWASICAVYYPGSTGSDDVEELTNAPATGHNLQVTPVSTTSNWAAYNTGWMPQTTSPPTTVALTIITTSGGSGTVQGTAGGLNCVITNGVTSATGCSVTIQINSSPTISAQPASGSTFSGFSAPCGSNAICTIPSTSTGTNLVIQVSFLLPGSYTYTSQQPVLPVAFSQNAQSIFYQPLPADVMSHLQGNTSSATNSNGFGQCYVTSCGAGINNGIASPSSSGWGINAWNSYGNYNNHAEYWSATTDPWYTVTGCAYCGGNESGITFTFQAPNNFLIPGANGTGAGSGTSADRNIEIWDQGNGQIVSLYYSGGSQTQEDHAGVCPNSAHAGTQADPCTIPITWSAIGGVSNYYTSRDWQSVNQQGLVNLNSSIGDAPMAAQVRVNEITSGAIPHASVSSAPCINSPTEVAGSGLTAFPAYTSTGDLACGSGAGVPAQHAYRPYAGMHFFLDYTATQLNCLDPAQPVCTYSDLTFIPKVFDFQMIWLRQLSFGGNGSRPGFGIFVAETGGSDTGNTVTPDPAYGLDDYATVWQYYYDLGQQSSPFNSPIWALLQTWANETGAANWAVCGGARSGTNPSQKSCTIRSLSAIPLLPGISGLTDANGNSCSSTHGCDLSGHMQVADQCVAIAQAGLSSYNGVNACP